jgi:hypothetical protein
MVNLGSAAFGALYFILCSRLKVAGPTIFGLFWILLFSSMFGTIVVLILDPSVHPYSFDPINGMFGIFGGE